MASDKQVHVLDVAHSRSSGELPEDEHVDEKYGTSADRQAMYRLGKTQQTRRNFRGITIFGFSMVLLSAWEATLGVAVIGLLNGGSAGLIWMYIVSMVGFFFVIASLAEMASMSPTAGGQYHWVSEFAPRSCQKFLSYIVGWLCVMGWQVGCASVAFLAGTEIQGLLVLNHPISYVYERWHGTLLIFAVVLFAIFFNTTLAKRLPLVEGLVLILHIFGFFAILIPLWVMADLNPAHETFTVFSDYGGWGNIGLSTMVGMLAGANCFVGSDAAAHMAEEVRDASYVLPRAMMWSWLVNGTLGFIMAITFCFCIGPDLFTVLMTPTGYPFMQMFYNATGSVAGATVMTCIILVMAGFGLVCNVATCSRQLFAFARDRGVPFSDFFATIPPNWEIPLNALWLTTAVTCLLALINIGSTVAFNQIISLGVGSMLTSYMISIGCVALKRIRNEPLPPSRFNLGKFGLPCNIIAMCFLVIVYVFSFFPTGPKPDPADANWSPLMYGAVIIFAVLYYVFRGRHRYTGPVEQIKKEF